MDAKSQAEAFLSDLENTLALLEATAPEDPAHAETHAKVQAGAAANARLLLHKFPDLVRRHGDDLAGALRAARLFGADGIATRLVTPDRNIDDGWRAPLNRKEKRRALKTAMMKAQRARNGKAKRRGATSRTNRTHAAPPAPAAGDPSGNPPA